ncbi:MAG: pseudaminic acid cytidylyltransferase, partial [Bacteroidetes bacterium]|nr:pseudaminic acid cytidylyltransferase [Bacteroidota bacterium]
MSSIAIITARGGSKRIPGKNLKIFCGKPIIQYSIEAAQKSGLFEEIMVSTNDPAIAELGKKLGVSVPFLRSETTSNDSASIPSALIEVLLNYKEIGREFDYACCIFPTAPFITSSMLNNTFNILIEPKVDTVFPITVFDYPIQRSLEMDEE